MPPADSCMFIFGINFGPHLGHIWATFGPHLGHIWAKLWAQKAKKAAKTNIQILSKYAYICRYVSYKGVVWFT